MPRPAPPALVIVLVAALLAGLLFTGARAERPALRDLLLLFSPAGDLLAAGSRAGLALVGRPR